uniref:GDNF family receptor alpha 2 n=1 Tax=Seriola dumerili TaxID=41447 RepID=A0A3B4V699_SERDU
MLNLSVCLYICLCVCYSLQPQPEWVDCIQASDMCNQNPYCSSRYRVMRQCLVGKEKEAMLDNNRECQAALEVLLVSPLYDCRCKRGMKKELQCLQNYWTIHMGLTEAPNRHPDAFRLASISSGNTGLILTEHVVRNCNPCLDAAKACNLNNSCKRQRSSYIATCSKEDPNKGETCSKKRCHKALRMFLDRVPTEYSHRLLFCPCQTEGCAERRRQTIVPDCSYKDKEKPNCLELRRVCRQDSLCRSRLADYLVNCWMTPHAVSTCPNQDNHQACLASYARLIGTEMTPNYVDSSFSNWTISPWCTCKGSGNQEEECMNFLKWTYYKKNQKKKKNTPPLSFHETRILNSGKIIKLNTLHHSHSHHIQSLCLLKQLAHQNRRFMIRQFMLHPR